MQVSGENSALLEGMSFNILNAKIPYKAAFREVCGRFDDVINHLWREQYSSIGMGIS